MDRLQLKLNNLKHSRIGIVSTVLGVISLTIFISLIFILMVIKPVDETQLVLVGFLGLVSLITSVIGFFFGIIGLFQQEAIKMYSLIGLIGNGIIAVMFMYFYYLGIVY
ncbi:hypothetical protein EDC18_1141 [Natranaerovirga pectinivora]|uniref:Uncharacterized protein n=1 Tax=Natranaerovirga pectinivora TaxID=682400 RepID=A0A4R3MG16_9FIRM|nr:DUF6142 family protein [Natranaerovirga pectinivora]TCT12102.1 hypothetical protein EDC18_1141 [Natranaerovirga pectinivora]